MGRPRIYESSIETQRAYRKRHPDLVKKHSDEYYKKNRDKVLEKHRLYLSKPEVKVKRAIYSSIQRHRRGVDHKLFIKNLSSLIDESKHCPLCGIEMPYYGKYPDGKTIDHVKPLCIGGDNSVGNLRIVCFKCNISRPKKHFSLTPEQQ